MRFSKHLAVAVVGALVGGMATPGIAAAGTTPSWSIQSTPSPDVRHGSILLGVSCSSATTCTAVGGYAPSANALLPLAERWNGTKWVVQPTPNPAGSTNRELVGVSCPSARVCVAVGDYDNTAGTDVTLAERWNGKKWSLQSTPNPATSTDGTELLGVSCSSPSSCTAVGASSSSGSRSDTLAEHWNGRKWVIQAAPKPPSGNESELAAVSCQSATSCTAVGNYETPSATVTLAERWNGRKWVVQSTPNPAGNQDTELDGVSCPSATVCTATGHYAGNSDNDVTLAERWNGKKWAIQLTPNPADSGASRLQGVSCSSATACTAVGPYVKKSGAEPTLAERYSSAA